MNDVRYIDVEIDCQKLGKMTIIFIKSTLEHGANFRNDT
jgi:hypothetical protein